MLNKVILIGRLTRDPELRSTTGNISVTTFTLAVDRKFTNQQGEREADFIPIVTWRSLAETCHKYLSKGRLVAVTGRLQVRTYEGNDGQKRYVTEVVADEVQFLERSTSTGSTGGDNQYSGSSKYPGDNPYPGGNTPGTGFDPVDEEDDELPF